MTKSRAPDQEKSGTDHFEKSPILLPSPQTGLRSNQSDTSCTKYCCQYWIQVLVRYYIPTSHRSNTWPLALVAPST